MRYRTAPSPPAPWHLLPSRAHLSGTPRDSTTSDTATATGRQPPPNVAPATSRRPKVGSHQHNRAPQTPSAGWAPLPQRQPQPTGLSTKPPEAAAACVRPREKHPKRGTHVGARKKKKGHPHPRPCPTTAAASARDQSELAPPPDTCTRGRKDNNSAAAAPARHHDSPRRQGCSPPTRPSPTGRIRPHQHPVIPLTSHLHWVRTARRRRALGAAANTPSH